MARIVPRTASMYSVITEGCRKILVFAILVQLVSRVFGQTDQQIYTDSLQNGWQNWGWATLNYNNSKPVHSGSSSIAVTIADTSYQAIYIAHTAFDSTPYSSLSFWINGGNVGGQKLQIQGLLGSTAQTAVSLTPLPTNAWQKITVSLQALGVAGQPDFSGFWIQDRIGAIQPTFFLDDLTLVAATNAPAPTTNAVITVTVDRNSNRRPISPLIYGVAFATSNQLADLGVPLNRSGGNSETRYNWVLNAHNHAADWYFESIADSSATPAATPDDFVANSKAAAAAPILTIPMIGWAPKLGPNRGKLASYSIAKYGGQTGNDSQWFTDAGNGICSSNGLPVTWNDATDANFSTNSLFQRAFVSHIVNHWGPSTNGGVRFFAMDNEHSIWQSTHQDVRPVGATMTEIRDRLFDYASQVKAVDPNASIMAPEEWGWSGYLYSGYDQQYGAQHNWASFPDRSANGGMDYVPWLLAQFRQRETNTNQRLLDYLTVHFYPQGGEYGSDTSAATQLLRNRSTRSLWDTNYVDASWINSVVMLIPRLRNWVSTYYPGTKIGLTEYNWGAESHINGATTQADILGILGREGLDLATRWTTPDATTPTYKAIKLYRNYDGMGSAFGETSLKALAANPDNLSVFAAERAGDGALTIIAINKQLASGASLVINLTNFQASGAAQVWQLTSVNSIKRLPDLSLHGASLSNNVPSQSITLFVVPAATTAQSGPILLGGSINGDGTLDLRANGQPGQLFALQSTTDLINWSAIQTNTLTTNSWRATFPIDKARPVFYRAKVLP